jgi:hypothetical protein
VSTSITIQTGHAHRARWRGADPSGPAPRFFVALATIIVAEYAGR